MYIPLGSQEKLDYDEDQDGSSLAGISLRSPRECFQRRWRGCAFAIANILFFCISISTLIAAILLSERDRHSLYTTSLNPLLKKTSYFCKSSFLLQCLHRLTSTAPLFDRLPVALLIEHNNNTLYNRNIYSSLPSPSVDAAWDTLSQIRLTTVSTADIVTLGKDPSLTVRSPHDPDAHVVMVTVNHQLHCLNSLRKNLFPAYYFPNGSSAPLHTDHLLHCLELLRHTLTCNANLDLITYNWMEIQSDPVPDFNVNMVCRDWEGLTAWQDQMAIDMAEWPWQRQGGERNVSAPWQWWELWRNMHPEDTQQPR